MKIITQMQGKIKVYHGIIGVTQGPMGHGVIVLHKGGKRKSIELVKKELELPIIIQVDEY